MALQRPYAHLFMPEPEPEPEPRRRIWRVLVLLTAVLLAASGVYIALAAMELPDPEAALAAPAAPSITVLDRHGDFVARRGLGPTRPAAIQDLPPILLNAVIAVEDQRFRSHAGVDPVGVGRAAMANLTAGRLVQGGSTLTQQLARNLFLTQERTFKRKTQEIILALWLERRFTKDEILELYLNRVYFGAGAWGVSEATRRYFGKTPDALTVAEAALLAGLLQAPTAYSPALAPRRAEDRATFVVNLLARRGVITAQERSEAMRTPILIKRSSDTALAGHFVDWVAQEARTLPGVYGAELVVETTLDLTMQAAADAALAATMTDETRAAGATQAAIAAMEGDGAVRAMAGGLNYRTSQFNRAVQAQRQPGSAFKTFVYTAAMERGLRPDTMRMDAALSVEGWSPRNYREEHRGLVSLREAFTQSINTVAVSVSEEIDRRNVAATARRLGVVSDLPATPALALGAYEVSLLELTGAYAPFANRGYRVAPYAIRSVRAGDGTVLYQRRAPSAPQVLDDNTRRTMTGLMANVVESGTGRRAAPGREAAGKTGTTNDHRDAWFVGFVPGFIAGVWVGDDAFRPMEEVVGGGLPAQLWAAFMREALEDIPARPLDRHPRPVNEEGSTVAVMKQQRP